jgi:very-short-patch-repair endonuclease
VRNFMPDEATEFARAQRQAPSRAEHLLWQQLRDGRLGGVKFKRQVPFGAYTADFSCASARLIVEIDVLRFTDEEVLMDTDRVVRRIADAARTRRAPSPGLLRRPPSPSRGEG